MNGTLARKAIAGVKITFGASVATIIVQSVILVALARLISPEDYGRYAIIYAVWRLTLGLVLGAMERALVVASDEVAARISPLVPLVITAIVVALTTLAYLVFRLIWPDDNGMIFALLFASGLALGFALPSRVHLRRRFEFGPLAAADLVGQVLGTGGLTIAAALAGMGPEALAIGALGQAVISALIVVMACRPDFSVPFDWSALTDVTRRAASAGQAATTELIASQTPTVLIGWILGYQSLGLFNRIYSLIQLPLEILVNSMTRVLVSGLVATRDEPARSRRALGRLVTVSVCLMSPIAGGILGSYREFIYVVLGPSWMEGAAITPLLVAFTWLGMTAHVFAMYPESLALYRAKTVVQIQAGIVLVAGIAIGAYVFGLVGATAGLVAGSLAFLVLNIALTRRHLPIELAELIGWFRPGLVAGLVAFLWAVLAAYVLGGYSAYVVLAIQVAGCGLFTVLYLFLAERELAKDLMDYIGLGRF